MTPLQLLDRLFEDPTDLDHVRALCTEDFEYVSLAFDNPELKRIMPWAGVSPGPEGLVNTFKGVGRYWTADRFEMTDRIEDDDKAAVFGSFTYTSTTLGKTVTSPFSILLRTRGGKCSYFRFMEDTFATADSFRSGGAWQIEADPDGGRIEV